MGSLAESAYDKPMHSAAPSPSDSDWTESRIPAALIQALSRSVTALDQQAGVLQLPGLAGREWYELLVRKLLPQLGQHSFLIVAVVGGTNLGKSVVFNHIAGHAASATSPTASGTKHPTALVSPRLLQHIKMDAVFPDFEIRDWDHPEHPLQADDAHRLFVRVSEQMPDNLIILDTPDIDSVTQVNWERAARIRRSADVLIAVLTQQKYNDAAIKTFFRAAAEEDKLAIVIFNQCLLPEDEEFWPLWMATFAETTGIQPRLIYIAPNDRRAAESLTLPFYERHWPEPNAEAAANTGATASPRRLLQELSQLKFDAIKVQAFAGALRQVTDEGSGIPGWLKEMEFRAREFQDALTLLSSDRLAKMDRWPLLPNKVLIDAVRDWWRQQREGWSASVHGVYRQLGKLVALPVKLLRQHSSGSAEDPLEVYRRQEWQAALEILQSSLERLEQLRDLGHPLLRDQIGQMLSGLSREQMIDEFRARHQALDFAADLQTLINQQLNQFREERPDFYRLIRRMDTAAAAARPLISLTLFFTGAGPLGEAVIPAMAGGALSSVFHLAGEAVGGTVVTAVGDKALTDAAGGGLGYVEAKLRQLHTAFASQRAQWMSQQLDQLLLKGLPDELVRGAQVPILPEFLEVKRLTRDLQQRVREL
jgi:hypothetical protein